EISSKRLARFVGSRQRLLVEEAVEQEDLWLCRGWMHAPEVDGLVVLHADKNELAPGQMVEAEIIGINGIDLEARLLPLHRL
ncbi:MAG: 30S ribosomal protein S12 methylthiotransferase RimO, partial [Acidobacteria bacterium]